MSIYPFDRSCQRAWQGRGGGGRARG